MSLTVKLLLLLGPTIGAIVYEVCRRRMSGMRTEIEDHRSNIRSLERTIVRLVCQRDRYASGRLPGYRDGDGNHYKLEIAMGTVIEDALGQKPSSRWQVVKVRAGCRASDFSGYSNFCEGEFVNSHPYEEMHKAQKRLDDYALEQGWNVDSGWEKGFRVKTQEEIDSEMERTRENREAAKS